MDFHWGVEEENSFQEIKSALTKDPVLAHFNQQDPICLKTDASIIGVAGILLQRQNGDWRIITCCSRSTTNCERNYGITDLEGLAIVYSLIKLGNYLLGRHFLILTDHCALCALKLKMPNSPRLRRWALLLSEFNFSIHYIKGTQHNDVHCLSRAPVDVAEDNYLDGKVLVSLTATLIITVVVPLDLARWKKESEEDSDAVPHYIKARSRQKGYKLLNALLYLDDKLFVPKTIRKELIYEKHDETPGGHGGIRATLDRLRSYWWPKMALEVREYISSCDNCQRNKVERQMPVGTMFSFNSQYPLDLVEMDVLGPLPMASHLTSHACTNA